jgi:hypothetical protein
LSLLCRARLAEDRLRTRERLRSTISRSPVAGPVHRGSVD